MQKEHHIAIPPHYILLLIVALGSILRIYHLGYFDLWYDEAMSVRRALNLDHFFGQIKYTYQPPLYYVLLNLWIRCFGNSEFAIRCMSACPSILSLPLIYILGVRFYSRRVGIISALILALSPFHIWYAQEARMFSLSVFLALLMIELYCRSKDHPTILWWLLCVIVTVINIYLNYFSIFILLPTLVLIFSTKKTHQMRLLLCSILILFLIAPLALIIINQISNIEHCFWLQTPDLLALVTLFGNYIVGYNGTVYTFVTSIVLFAVLLSMWLIKAEKKTLFFILIGYTLLPIITIFIFAQTIPVFLPRHLLLFSPIVYIIMSKSISQIKNKWALGALSSVFIFLLFTSLNNYYTGLLPTPLSLHIGVLPKMPFKPIVMRIRAKLKEGDVIAHSNNSTWLSFLYYFRDNPITQWYLYCTEDRINKFDTSIIDSYIGHPTRYPNRNVFLERVVRIGENNKFYDVTNNQEITIKGNLWLITGNWLRDQCIRYESQLLLSKLNSTYKRVEQFFIDGIYVTVYSME